MRNFPGGPGRRPGATVVPVFIRQTVREENGNEVFAVSETQLADVAGDAIEFRVQIRNESPYDVGTVELHHAYRTVREGPKITSIGDVSGGVYVPDDHMFVVDRVPAGQTVDLTYTLFLDRPLKQEISQSAVTLHDFIVLDPESRFPERFRETVLGRHRTTIEKMGLGGKEVSCFTGENADRFVLGDQQGIEVIPPRTIPRQTPPAAAQVDTVNTASLTPEEIRDNLTLQKRVSGSMTPGGGVTATITVRNGTNGTLEDVLVDDRFDGSRLIVRNDAGGVSTRSGIQWLIPVLPPGQSWSITYDATINNGLRSGDRIPSTVTLFGEQLLDVPTSALSESHDIVLASEHVMIPQAEAAETPNSVVFPQTGVEDGVVSMFLQILIGVVMALVIYGASVRILWKKLG